nr:GH92 family glycosyl hydrolase [uncultured Pseudokineococcus sp.]
MLNARRPALLTAAAALVAGLLVAPGASAAPAPPPPDEGSLTDLVNPFIGTQDEGNTFPGASLPFGMVQLSPDDGHTTGYDYTRDRIRGFSATHISGVGCGLGGDLPVLPTTGEVTSTDYAQYALPFSHDGESASPGYYTVPLEAPAGTITAELTATTRTGVSRYTFPETDEATVLVNAGQALHRVESSDVRVVGDRTIETTVVGSGFCQVTRPYTMHFTTTFDRPFVEVGTWSGDEVTAGSTATSGTDRQGAYVRFDAREDRTVEQTTALSWVDADGARANLAAEGGRSFDEVRAAADATWEERLGQVRTEGGTPEQRRTFYSSLYRSLLTPSVATDVDGRYTGWDQQVHEADGFTYYQTFSLWDTYRTQQQLLSLLAPQESRDMALSLLAVEDQGGWLPRWAYATVETNIMTGDPVTPFLVSAWRQGLLAGHEEEAYEALLENADGVPPAGSQYNGRAGNEHYLEHGYVPHEPQLSGKPGDYDLQHGASATLEYALADATLSTMAAALGHEDDARRLALRGQSFRNLFDPRTGSFRARDAQGLFVGPEDPADAVGFHEGTSAQYTWLVQQDLQQLVDLLGGEDAANARLDGFFAYDQLLEDPERTAREVWVSSAYDYYGFSTYNPQNEPDLHAPYVYGWTGQPWKTTDVVHAALTLFTDGPQGITGNDDLGTMSSWQVLSAMGIYPSVPGTEVWSLSTPIFDRVDLALDPEWYPEGSFTITAPGTSETDRYVQSVRVGGRTSPRTWITGDDIRAGRDVAFRVGPEPSRWGTDVDLAPEPLVDGRVRRSDLAAGLVPGRTDLLGSDEDQVVDVTATLVVTDPGRPTVRLDLAADEPLRAELDRDVLRVRSAGLPTTQELPLQVVVPAGTAPGSYDVRLRARDRAGDVVERTAVVTVVPRCGEPGGSCPVDLSGAYDVDGVATSDARAEGDFDGGGWSFPAEELPAPGEQLVGGRTYVLPETSGTAPNFVTARGQEIALEPGSYAALDVLLSAHNGDFAGDAVVTYADGSTSAARLTATDWAASGPRLGEETALVAQGRYSSGGGGDGLTVHVWHDVLALDPAREAVSLRLPDESRIKVMAISARTPAAAGEPVDPAADAQEAYAAMQEHLLAGDRSGLYAERVPARAGDRPYSFEWPFSQAHVAALDLTGLAGEAGEAYADDLARHGDAQELYWDAAGSATGLPGYDSYPHAPYGDGGDLFYDDNLWVGLAMVQQHLMTGDEAALERAEQVFRLAVSGWDDDPTHAAPGGVFWTQQAENRDRNTVSTMPAAQLAVRLHMITGEQRYLDWALRMAGWTDEHLLGADGLYADHLSLDGTVEQTRWAYNQGVPVGTYALLFEATGEQRYLQHAQEVAEASYQHYVVEGRLDDQPRAFVAIWAKNLLLLEATTGGTRYRDAVTAWAQRQHDGDLDASTGLYAGDDGATELLDQAAVTQVLAVLAWPQERVRLLY